MSNFGEFLQNWLFKKEMNLTTYMIEWDLRRLDEYLGDAWEFR